MEALETALVVAVPEAEPVVGSWRARLDPAATIGVPAHVTVLYPFVPGDQVDDDVLAAVTDLVAAAPAFDVVFERVAWFDDAVAWLAPEPAEPFRDLTLAVCRRFPHLPPYGGRFAGLTPHLTIGDGGPAADLRSAAAAVAALLPVRTRVTQIALIARSPADGLYRTVHEFPLASSPRS